MSKRQHEVFSQANSGRRMPQVASTAIVASVIKVHKEQTSRLLLINDQLMLSVSQPLWINRSWKFARDIQLGDQLLSINGQVITVYDISSVDRSVDVLHLSTVGGLPFFAEDILVQSYNAPRTTGALKRPPDANETAILEDLEKLFASSGNNKRAFKGHGWRLKASSGIAWNQWRQEHPEIRPDLTGVDLSNANLSGADLSNADLRFADLSNANLSGADLSEADLNWADLSNADLSGTDLGDANLSNADLSGADLRFASLSNANLSNADLGDANLT